MAEPSHDPRPQPPATPAGPALTVVICAHNPEPERLRRTLAGLSAQDLTAPWEILIVDNVSDPALSAAEWQAATSLPLRIVTEPVPGLSHARACGLAHSSAPVLALVDDDNVLAPDYLRRALDFLREHPGLGAVGGRVVAEFEREPAPELRPFLGLLALRDPGEEVLVAEGFRDGAPRSYPLFAPIGAGMVFTRQAAEVWLAHFRRHSGHLTDRRGGDLSSSGDNDMVLAMLAAGLGVAYLPSLSLTHLIPAARLDPDYLARLNRGIQTSWMQVLALHGASPWPPLSPLGARLRRCKAWLRHQPWRSAAARIRYAGACGHFQGRVGR